MPDGKQTKARLDRLRKGAKLATVRQQLYDKIQEVQSHIARLLPAKYMTKLLKDGDIGSEMFVQRMLDQGYSLAESLNEFNKIRNGPGGEHIKQLADGSVLGNPMPYTKPVKRSRIPNVAVPEQTPVAPPSYETACKTCIVGLGNASNGEMQKMQLPNGMS